MVTSKGIDGVWKTAAEMQYNVTAIHSMGFLHLGLRIFLRTRVAAKPRTRVPRFKGWIHDGSYRQSMFPLPQIYGEVPFSRFSPYLRIFKS